MNHIHHESHNRDVWEERWGDATLQELGRWLTEQGIGDSDASLVVDSVWVFYSYSVLPFYGHRVTLGIGVDQDNNSAYVDLYIPDPDRQTVDKEQIGDVFAHTFASALPSYIQAQLVTFTTREYSNNTIEHIARRRGFTYLGTFEDELEGELAKVMKPETVEYWLDAPNSIFGGRPPRRLLQNSQEDQPLRDLILSLKHGMMT